MQRQKSDELLKRNFIISAIIMISVIALLLVNRQRQRLKYKHQLVLQQKAAAESEVLAAKEQLNMFTQNIIEKSSIIEKLEQQLKDKELTFEQQQLINELTKQTILTEDDWNKFKNIFEKIYPGFFIHLKEKVSDITVAEQRMAALTRLQFSVNQVASMLGISANSVYKTKQRLRQRLHVGTEMDIEDILSRI